MSVADNKRLLQQFVQEVVDGKSLAAADKFLSPNFFHHDLAPGEQTGNQTGRDGLKRFFSATVFPAFSGFKTSFQDMIGEKDLVAGRWTQSVQQTGPWLGHPPSNRNASIGGISIVRIRDNSIVEEWEARDTVSLLQTFGVIQRPKPLEAGGALAGGGGITFPLAAVRTGGALTTTVAGGAPATAVAAAATVLQPASDANKTAALSFVTQVLNGGNMKAVDQLFTSDFVNHDSIDGQQPGRDGIKQFTDRFKTAFPDSAVTPDMTVAEGDKVAVRWSALGSHKGVFLGLPGSGRQVRLAGIDIVRIRGSQIAEKWGFWPLAETLQQMGGAR